MGAIGAPCNDDGFACCPFQALIEKAPHTGISPTMLQLLTLKPLIFAELFHEEFNRFHKIFGQALIHACPRVLLSSIQMCLFVKYSHPQYFDWNTGMMFGAMLAASDHVAVLAGMKELAANLSLFTIISLGSMNDRRAVVLFIPFLVAMFDDKPVEAGGIVLFTIVNICGGGRLRPFVPFASTFLLSVVIMVINFWSSDITREDVLHLLWIYLSSLAARGVTVAGPGVQFCGRSGHLGLPQSTTGAPSQGHRHHRRRFELTREPWSPKSCQSGFSRWSRHSRHCQSPWHDSKQRGLQAPRLSSPRNPPLQPDPRRPLVARDHARAVTINRVVKRRVASGWCGRRSIGCARGSRDR